MSITKNSRTFTLNVKRMSGSYLPLMMSVYGTVYVVKSVPWFSLTFTHLQSLDEVGLFVPLYFDFHWDTDSLFSIFTFHIFYDTDYVNNETWQ